MMYRKYFKRLLDFLLAVIAIIVLSPIMIIIAILVRVKLGSPVLFRQQRPGLNEHVFNMYKFRTMTDQTGPDGDLLPDHIRLTKFGKMLRLSSLDELPELFNIIKGDMSIIGPRPLLVKYLDLYDHQQKRRHEVRPGLTGLAQISGRNSITWEEKFRQDIKYIDNISFLLDCKIIFQTVKKVFSREGINAGDLETMEEFKGSEG